MATRRLTLVLSFVTAGSISSFALAAPRLCPDAVELKINRSALKFIAKRVRPLVPKQVTIPPISAKLHHWNIANNDLIAELPELQASIDLKDVSIAMSGPDVSIRFAASVALDGKVTLHNPYAGLGRAGCQAKVELDSVTLEAAVRPGGRDGRVEVPLTAAALQIDPGRSRYELDDCAIGDLLTKVLDFLRTQVTDTIRSRAEAMIKEKLPGLLTDKVNEMVIFSKEIEGIVFSAGIEAVETHPDGITVRFAGDVNPALTPLPQCLLQTNVPGPPDCGVRSAGSVPAVPTMFGATISQGMLNKTLYAAWRTGKLCVDSRAFEVPTLSPGLRRLQPFLTPPEDVELSFAVGLRQPPELRFTHEGKAELDLDGIEVRFTKSSPHVGHSEAWIKAGLTLRVKPWVNPAGNSVGVELDGISDIRQLHFVGADGKRLELPIDPARLTSFVDRIVLPLLGHRMTRYQLSPSLVDISSSVLELRHFEIDRGRLVVHAEGHHLPRVGDKVAPETQLSAPAPKIAAPGIIRLDVEGLDNLTPAPLVRFKARVDGGPWSEPSYGRSLPVAVVRGIHQVEIAAVDHEDNVDPTPLQLSIPVDDVAPEITLLASPEPLLAPGASATVRFSARDDRSSPTTMRYEATLYRAPEGEIWPETLAVRELGPGASNVTFDQIGAGTFAIMIAVTDEAGNTASRLATFAIQSGDSGCAVVGPPPPPAPLLLLAMVLVAGVLRRRQEHRASADPARPASGDASG